MAQPVSIFLDGHRIQCDGGHRLLDILDDYGPLLPTGCRAAHCGACRVRIVAGAAGLAPAETSERETLAALGAEPQERLGCQIVVNGLAAEIRLMRITTELDNGSR